MDTLDFEEDEEFYFPFKGGINFDREIKQHSIHTFLFDIDNVLDDAIDELIKNKKVELKSHIKELKKYQKDLDELDENDYDSDTYVTTQAEILGVSQDVMYIEEVLSSLFEVKIIYAYKHLEITLKSFLSYAYEEKSINKSFKWQSFVDLLKSKRINMNGLNGYTEVNELRIANNSFKHSGNEVDNSIQSIKEFRKGKYINYNDLEKFYARIKEYPKIFLNSLQAAVNDDLFEFSDDRLKSVAESFALRMDEDTAKKFANTLLKLYK